MRFSQQLTRAVRKLRTLPKRYTIPGAVLFCVLVLYGIIYLIPKSVTFSYSDPTCTKYFTFFPSTYRTTNDAFDIKLTDEIKVGGAVVGARTLCFTPKQAPQEGEQAVAVSPWGGWFARKTFALAVGAPPAVDKSFFDKPVSATKPLMLALAVPDTVFDYRLTVAKKQLDCEAVHGGVTCGIQSLNLRQGAPYKLTLSRHFNGSNPTTLVDKNIRTLSATKVTKTSMKQNQTIYNIPKSFTLTFDKPVVKAEPALYQLKGKQKVKIETTTERKQKTVTVTLKNKLPRDASFQLVTTDVEAEDGSGLEDPHKLSFKTSGGPKVTGVNIGRTGVASGTVVAVSFDQALHPSQDLAKIIKTSGGAKYTGRAESQLFFSVASVPRCGDFSIGFTNSIKSKYGISGHSAWNYSSRTICHTVSTFGYSHQGRPMNAYYFGNGGTTVMYTGAIHGNEYSTYALMQAWIQELEANARSIPKNKTIVVVPQVNPDGFASGSRYNARNVDLNRNFATGDWRKDITTVNNTPFKGGGGKVAMSEKETQALAGLASRTRPALILSYHSIGGVVAANQAGRSSSLAAQYASQAGYANVTGNSDDTFEYSVTGTADDWYAQKLGVPSILIELASHSYHEFDRNRAAMWAMARL